MPPTKNAAHYHGLRVHLQIIEWKMLDESANLNPEEWGWKIENGCFSPNTTDNPIPPDDVLKVIRWQILIQKSVWLEYLYVSKTWFAVYELLWWMSWGKL